ncbi:probable L-type lectin-domain containing receptor kinase V.3 isoform X1 [Salvia splendens]|uniref:probable L-type lectin-domain containing receptor kinase V.3 isoform X1 n=1 Tax=Salvia splendens TaxID=180675 RepID=UPI001C26E383|nr:probable L-type lectin-domain containing receptor kinase V.3 isoform X1 [Salvia splendens]
MKPRMMNTQNLLFLTYSSLFILSLQFFQNCCAKCPPSSCGLIPIRSPFRLSNCGDPGQELVCENNVTLMYVDSRKYYVKEIHYQNFTMRVSDISTDNNICSFPIHSSSDYDDNRPFKSGFGFAYKLISLVSCEHPLRNSSLFTKLTDCEQYSKYTYINVGNMRVKDLDHMCTLDTVLATSWAYQDSEFLSNVSLSEIHQSLLYGFNLNWYKLMCLYGKEGVDPDELVSCDRSDLQRKLDYIKDSFLSPKGPTGGFLMILMLILAIVFIGVGIAAKIIITITFVVIFRTETEADWLIVAQSVGEIPTIVDIEYHFNASNSAIVYLELRFILGFLCAVGFLIYKFQRRRLSAYEEIESFLQSDNHLSPIRYSYSEIKKMTRNFREKLGEGGFGSVYKGKLQSGHYVAVKLLGKAKINDKDFINEIGTIGRIHHANVVQLIGYCAERSKRALVLDFMPNGSLDKYIFKPKKTSSLDWGMKFKIAVGAARGIEYLHSGCDIKILHFDIKPHNILLDDKFVPKVTDFGLAKLYSIDKEAVTMTAARGTIGYIAPELNCRSIGLVSHKADVYSFGMLLMEMAGVNNKDDPNKYFPDWIYDCINKGEDLGIVEEDNNVDDVNENGKNVLKKMTIVGLWCIQMNPDNRPSMNKVLEMLEGDVEDLKIPEHPSHLVNEARSWDADSNGSVSQSYYDSDSIKISIA